jgi:hypothetical protein
MAREQPARGIDGHRRVVDGERDLTEADRDQAHLARVGGDVAGGVDPWQVRRHRRRHLDPPGPEVEAPRLERAEVGHEAERDHDCPGVDALNGVGRQVDDLDRLHPAIAVDGGQLGAGEDPDGGIPKLLDRPLIGAEALTAVHQGDRAGHRQQGRRPVDGAVAAADDDHVQARVVGGAAHEVLQAATRELAAHRERPRVELSDPSGDDDRPGPDGSSAGGAQPRPLPVVGQ